MLGREERPLSPPPVYMGCRASPTPSRPRVLGKPWPRQVVQRPQSDVRLTPSILPKSLHGQTRHRPRGKSRGERGREREKVSVCVCDQGERESECVCVIKERQRERESECVCV